MRILFAHRSVVGHFMHLAPALVAAGHEVVFLAAETPRLRRRSCGPCRYRSPVPRKHAPLPAAARARDPARPGGLPRRARSCRPGVPPRCGRVSCRVRPGDVPEGRLSDGRRLGLVRVVLCGAGSGRRLPRPGSWWRRTPLPSARWYSMDAMASWPICANQKPSPARWRECSTIVPWHRDSARPRGVRSWSTMRWTGSCSGRGRGSPNSPTPTADARPRPLRRRREAAR
jgi:hypothetical protein